MNTPCPHPLRTQQLVIKGYVTELSEEEQATYQRYTHVARRCISRGMAPAALALISVGIDFILGDNPNRQFPPN